MNEFNRSPQVQVTVNYRNCRMLNLRLMPGREMTQKDFCTQISVSVASYAALENCKVLPHKKSGDWRKAAVETAAYWGVELDWLFPPMLIERQVDKMVFELMAAQLPRDPFKIMRVTKLRAVS